MPRYNPWELEKLKIENIIKNIYKKALMKIKASDLEKQWGEDLEQRGVFEPEWKTRFREKFPVLITSEKAWGQSSILYKDVENFILEELEAQKDRICEKIEGNWDDRLTSQNTKNVLNQVLYIIKELVK